MLSMPRLGYKAKLCWMNPNQYSQEHHWEHYDYPPHWYQENGEEEQADLTSINPFNLLLDTSNCENDPFDCICCISVNSITNCKLPLRSG